MKIAFAVLSAFEFIENSILESSEALSTSVESIWEFRLIRL